MGALFFFPLALCAIAIRFSLATPWQLLLLGICIVYGVSPFLIGLGGMSLAERFGCDVEITTYTCPGNPSLGELITLMVFAYYWGAIFTIPSTILGFVGFLISLTLKTNTSRTEGTSSGRPTAAFYRSRRHKVIAGICAAIAQRWRLPILGVRISTVALVIITGIALPLYLWLWLAFPLEAPTESR